MYVCKIEVITTWKDSETDWYNSYFRFILIHTVIIRTHNQNKLIGKKFSPFYQICFYQNYSNWHNQTIIISCQPNRTDSYTEGRCYTFWFSVALTGFILVTSLQQFIFPWWPNQTQNFVDIFILGMPHLCYDGQNLINWCRFCGYTLTDYRVLLFYQIKVV